MKEIEKLIATGIVSFLTFVLIFVIVTILGLYNSAAIRKNTYEAKLKANTSDMDTMWKTIQQTAQVADAQKEGFLKIFTEYAQARTGKEAEKPMMNWIKEAVPTADLSAYKNLMNIITSSREGWNQRQKELVDIARQYNEMLVTQPSGFILGVFGFKHIDAKVITSTRTEKAFESGRDDDVSLPLGRTDK